MDKLLKFITDKFIYLVLIFALGALLFHSYFSLLDPSYISLLLGLIMFGMGMTLNLKDLKVVLSRPKDVLLGCLAQFTIMPLLAFLLTVVFSLPGDLAVGVILVGCCPGGTASNVMTFLSKGDLALSVAMTTCSTLLAPLLTPLLTFLLAGSYVHVDTISMFQNIAMVVILPVAAGFLVKWAMPLLTFKVAPFLPAVSSISILLVIVMVVARNSAMLLTSGLLILLVVISHNVLGLALGYLMGRALGLPEAKVRAMSIEVGMQNSGLACSLAQQGFPTLALATVPGAVFSVWHNISGAMVVRLFSYLSERGKKE